MPLEALLAMYGYGGGPAAGSATTGGSHNESAGSHSEEEILNNHDLTLDKEEVFIAFLNHRKRRACINLGCPVFSVT